MLKDEDQLEKEDKEQLATVQELKDAPGVKELAKFAKLWVKAVNNDQLNWTEL